MTIKKSYLSDASCLPRRSGTKAGVVECGSPPAARHSALARRRLPLFFQPFRALAPLYPRVRTPKIAKRTQIENHKVLSLNHKRKNHLASFSKTNPNSPVSRHHTSISGNLSLFKPFFKKYFLFLGLAAESRRSQRRRGMFWSAATRRRFQSADMSAHPKAFGGRSHHSEHSVHSVKKPEGYGRFTTFHVATEGWGEGMPIHRFSSPIKTTSVISGFGDS
jgi:hypothetical protein